jgi:hypothetical protein
MCEDGTQWCVNADYDKHIPPPRLTKQQIVALTSRPRAASRYFHGQDHKELERTAAREGVYVGCGQPQGNKVCKVYEFQGPIGASEGNESRWLFVQSTSGEFHGYPISEDMFSKRMKTQRPCCDD